MRWIGLVLVAVLAGCEIGNQDLIYSVKGQVVEFKGTNAVVVAHDPIEDFMGYMTMAFTASDSTELRGLAPGDSIRFDWIFGEKVTWIEGIERFYEADSAIVDTSTHTR